jgi:uncharacterized phage protein gp47/JayE
MALIAQVTEAGISAPTFADVLSQLQEQFRAIYGVDVNLDNDSADGQWVSIIAAAINDANASLISVYNTFSPGTASGAALSSVVKVNGIRRQVASKSTVDLRIVGQAGTTITNGAVTDIDGNRWILPASVVIPPAGEITVTATAQNDGALQAAANTVNRIATPTLGWQTVNNPDAATAGNPVETDAALRKRQANSVSLPSRSVWDGILASVSSLPGVSRLAGVDNDTGATDANGVPGHTISLVVEGGDATAIASSILLKKSPGVGTYGRTSVTVPDAYGLPRTIKFSRPTDVPIKARVTLKALAGYETRVATLIQQTVSDYINALAIGDDVILTRLYLPASLAGLPENAYFQLVSVESGLASGSFGTADIPIAFDAAASCTLSNVTIVVSP